jgi:hypothetical protein
MNTKLNPENFINDMNEILAPLLEVESSKLYSKSLSTNLLHFKGSKDKNKASSDPSVVQTPQKGKEM